MKKLTLDEQIKREEELLDWYKRNKMTIDIIFSKGHLEKLKYQKDKLKDIK